MAENNKKPFVLAVLDGWGVGKKMVGNPIEAAQTPVIDEKAKQYPMALLQASGPAVGMTWGETGNSEVGHLSIGAGRIVEQYLAKINRSVSDGNFFKNAALVGAFDHARQNNSKVHIVGLLTSGTVHASFHHLLSLLDMAIEKEFQETYLHLFMDGRDSGLQEGAELLTKLNDEVRGRGFGKIASVIGRTFGMDRDNNWDRTEKTFKLLAEAEGEKSPDLIATVKAHYAKDQNDPAMPPIVTEESGFSGMSDNDAVIFFNFREDSMRQIAQAFVEENFDKFERFNFSNLYICTMTQYLENSRANVAFMPPDIPNGLAETISIRGMTQFHIAETEKYAHVTYFFNGLRNQDYEGETDVFIESHKNHVENPEMKAIEIAEKVVEAIKSGSYDFIILNFANADLLAHSGNFAATVKGIETIDEGIGIIKEAVLARNGTMIITADHGNAEEMTYRGSGQEETKHNESPVPFYLIDSRLQTEKSPQKISQETREVAGILADVAPTVLELMQISQPQEMTGQSLIRVMKLNLES
ncbi:MAG: 2,3-bisphosphoglycerate-independent phosphoglycerate mutase [Candidatus Paceibacterota bacterium]